MLSAIVLLTISAQVSHNAPNITKELVRYGRKQDQNTSDRIPYAALDYRQKWFVLEAQDPALIKTNLFDCEQFRAAVQAVIDSQ